MTGDPRDTTRVVHIGPYGELDIVEVPILPELRAAQATAAERDAHRLNSLAPAERAYALHLEAELDQRLERAVLFGA